MSITTLYCIFKTSKKMGKLIHLAYVAAEDPHDALDTYLWQEGAQNPNALVAIPLSNNKFTMYHKRKKTNPQSLWRNRKLKAYYDRVRYWDIERPMGHLSRMEQLAVKYGRAPGGLLPKSHCQMFK